jgi:hypothetical protein
LETWSSSAAEGEGGRWSESRRSWSARIVSRPEVGSSDAGKGEGREIGKAWGDGRGEGELERREEVDLTGETGPKTSIAEGTAVGVEGGKSLQLGASRWKQVEGPVPSSFGVVCC